MCCRLFAGDSEDEGGAVFGGFSGYAKRGSQKGLWKKRPPVEDRSVLGGQGSFPAICSPEIGVMRGDRDGSPILRGK